MSNNHFHFTWVEHQDTIISLVQTLYNDERFFDCTLFADGHHFDVHRLILSTCSPFFSKILQEHKSEYPVITLDGVSVTELRALVEYMYTGETSIPPEFLSGFFQTTKLLEIAGLSQYDNKVVDEMLNENEITQVDDEEGEDEFQYNCEDDSQNILNCLEQSMKSDDKAKQLMSLGINLVSNYENIEESEFVNDESDLSGVINENSVIYDKFQGVFIKPEKEDSTDGIKEITFNSSTNSGARNRDTDESAHVNDDDEDEDDDDMDESAVIYGKFESHLIKNENDSIENEDGIRGDCCDPIAESGYDQNENESMDLQDNSENFVYVKLDNNTLQRVRGTQIAKIKQSNSERHLNVFSDKYLKMINPSKKNFLIKRPKIQNLVAKEAKTNPDDKKIYICLKCGNKYSHRRTLLHHIHWICDQPATYSCSLCPYMGKRKFQLKSHMKHAHMLRMS